MIYPSYSCTLKSLVDNKFDLGLNDYPIWSESHRSELNNKIINHYLMREIGAETPGLFKFYLNRTLNEIMPYYNKLYETTAYEYNAIGNADFTETHTLEKNTTQDLTSQGSNTGTATTSGENSVDYNGTTNSSNTNTAQGNNKTVDVDTPQSVLDLTDIDAVNYASKVGFKHDGTSSTGSASDTQTTNTTSEDNTSSSTSTNENKTQNIEGNEVETFTRRLHGNYGTVSAQSLIKLERELIINIDMMIIEELSSCFMQLW